MKEIGKRVFYIKFSSRSKRTQFLIDKSNTINKHINEEQSVYFSILLVVNICFSHFLGICTLTDDTVHTKHVIGSRVGETLFESYILSLK